MLGLPGISMTLVWKPDSHICVSKDRPPQALKVLLTSSGIITYSPEIIPHDVEDLPSHSPEIISPRS